STLTFSHWPELKERSGSPSSERRQLGARKSASFAPPMVEAAVSVVGRAVKTGAVLATEELEGRLASSAFSLDEAGGAAAAISAFCFARLAVSAGAVRASVSGVFAVGSVPPDG